MLLKFTEIFAKSSCPTGVNYTGGKFVTGTKDTSSKYSSGTGGEFATRWQKMGTISAFLHIKVNLKEKIYLYVYSAAQRCSNKIIKTFLIEDFSIRQQCQRHQRCTLSCEYVSQRILEKI
jgi:hypothetical protein